jgi:hypothetical protein
MFTVATNLRKMGTGEELLFINSYSYCYMTLQANAKRPETELYSPQPQD